MGFPGGSDAKESACSAGDLHSISWSGRFPGDGREPIPVFLPGESHVQKSLAGHSRWGRQIRHDQETKHSTL